MELADVPAPGEPGPGEVIVRPQAVGICGSDFHFLLGELGPEDGSSSRASRGTRWAPRWSRSGPDCTRGLAPGDRVALHPLSYCGRCYPCRIGRTNVCDNFSLIGIHEDGGLQEQLRMPESLVFSDQRAAAGDRGARASRCRSPCAPSTALAAGARRARR